MARAKSQHERVIALHKPYGVLSQFSPDGSKNRPLRDLDLPKDVWPIGRLDADSEGLLLLSTSARMTKTLLEPSQGHPREYWVQVERVPSPEDLARLEAGVRIQGKLTLPCAATLLSEPALPARDPPIRFRKSVPTQWLSLVLREGRNRQVRRMTAAIGYPTLRLMRVRIGAFWLESLAPGEWRTLLPDEIERVFSSELHAPPPENLLSRR